MPNTFNRRPFSVDTPSSSDSRDYFFDHYNWKGMASNKNFLAADQETFESCKNVYMNAEGLLRSRPSVKPFRELANKPRIYNFWVFANKILYLVKYDGAEDFDVVLTDFDNNVKLDTKESDLHYNDNKIKPVLVDNKIFIFAPDSFRYISLDNFSINDATSFIYTPTVEVTSGSATEKGELDNALTNAKIISYLYDSNFPVRTLKDKLLSVTIDDKTYEITFTEMTPYILYSKLSLSLIPENFVSAVCPRDGYDSIALLDTSTGQFLYSPTGTTWTINEYVPKFDGNVIKFSFSTSGNEIYYLVCKESNQPDVSDSVICYVRQLVDISPYMTEFKDIRTLYDELGIDLSVDGVNILNEYTLKDLELIDYYSGTLIFNTYNEAFFSGYICTFDRNNISKYEAAISSGMRVCRNDYYRYNDSIKSAFIVYSNLGITLYVLQSNVLTKALDISLNVRSQPVVLVYGVKFRVFCYDYNKISRFEISNSAAEEVFTEINVHGGDIIVSNDAVHAMAKYIVGDGSTKCLIWDSDANLTIHLLDGVTLDTMVGAGNYFYYTINGSLSIVTNNIGTIALKEVVEGTSDKLFEFSNDFINNGSDVERLSELYLAIGNSLYITSSRFNENGDFLWYIPKDMEQRFSSKINGLQPISDTEMSIFLDDSVWHSQVTENGYTYTKSKLQVGIKEGSDVITSYDGTQVIFPTRRGLAALSYQDFVASTEQSITFVSDAIHEDFVKFAGNHVKLLMHKYWLICYTSLLDFFVYDMRNGSWWPMSLHKVPDKVLDVDNEIIMLIDGKLFSLSQSDNEYYDYGKIQIDWNIKSQKLHMGYVNYTKHIANITLMSVLDSNNPMSFKLDVKNYRKRMDTCSIQTSEYKVDAIRTFVQRVSFPKVNEFQYEIFADDEQLVRVPLSLSGITIKYRIGSQVR